jgi:anti-sigma B factor antagonist
VAPVQLTVQHPDFDTVQVTITGSLDVARAYDFDDAIRRIERDAPGRMLVDLRSLEFLDTAGLSRLVALRRRCRRTGRRLVLVRGSLAVQRLFMLTAMNEHFELVRDPAELLAAA